MLVGSNVFFKNIEGFNSKDTDILELVDNPTDFKYLRQFRFIDKCVFQWRNMPVDEFIDAELLMNVPMSVCKFLCPEFIKLKGLTIEQLKRLQPLVDKMDEKHMYLKTIYDFYIANNDFTLTEQQLNDAYKMYLKYR
jgi:hypothetical protein